MDHKDILAIVAILLCMLLNFCFTLAEAALVTVGRTRLQHLVRPAASAIAPGEQTSAQRAEDSIQWLLTEPTRVVAAVQTGLTIFSLTSVAVAISLLAPDFAVWLAGFHVAHERSVAVVTLVVLIGLLTMVFGEIVPRAIASCYPERIALQVAGPLKWVERLERPLVAVVLGLSTLIVRPFGMTASFQSPGITEEDLRTILETSERQGVIQEDEKEMLHNVISFGDTLVHKVMTPRVLVRAIDVDQPLDKLINLIVDHGHSRIPVYQGSIDSIIGVIHAKDLLPSLTRGGKVRSLRELMRTPFFVPEQMRTDELLDEMRRSNMQIAIVQDEYGGTAGVVTIEDLLEEIVGEIQDEYDVEQPMIVYEEPGSALVDARMSIDEVNEEIGILLPTTDFDTIGGFVFGLFGRPPLIGDSIETIDGPNDDIEVQFTVTKADGRRLQQIKIHAQRIEPDSDSNVSLGENKSSEKPASAA